MKALEYAIVAFVGMDIGILLTLLVNKTSRPRRNVRRLFKKFKINTSGSLSTDAYNALLDALESEVNRL